MDEEILDALTKANAVDQESGLTIEKLMEVTGKNLDTIVMNIRRLRRDGKVQVSNENHLSNNADHAWPATQSIEVTGEAVAQAKREWKEQNHKPIVVWLGPAVLKELEEKKKEDERLERLIGAMSTPRVAVHGDNYGQIAAGDGNKQEQQSCGQSFRDSESHAPLIQNPANIDTATNRKRPILEIASWVGGGIGGLWAAWEIIKALS
ncbi:MAG: hypothetical protein JSR97_05925 [Verrucomicrobia bacterium]|nr:hypothetical protein [Verrucomicrobiota bacterium]